MAKDRKDHKALMGFRPPGDIEAAMEQAQAATGADVSEILIRCVRHALLGVVQEIRAEQEMEARKLADLTMKDDFRQARLGPPPKHPKQKP